jgi:hypothetical protein
VDFGVGFKTEWEVTLTDAKTGRVKLHLPWHKNTILDAGLNRRLTATEYFMYVNGTQYVPGLFRYIAIGTGATEPATTDTQLVTEVSRKIYNISLCSYSASVAAAPYFIVASQWGTSEGNGDLKEVALCESSSSGILWSRNLFRDGGGNPITVTKTTSDILTVKCKTTIQRASETPYSVTLDGRTVKGIILNNGLAAAACGSSSHSWWGASSGWYAATNNTDPAITQTTYLGTNLGLVQAMVWASAHDGPSGGFYREGVVTWLSYQGNGSIGEIVGDISSNGSILKSRHTFDAAMVKDDTKQLEITLRVTLSRV